LQENDGYLKRVAAAKAAAAAAAANAAAAAATKLNNTKGLRRGHTC